ncbi:hypothetical protein V8F20_011616 [Naviculisporaceae sp. PSN 640]
MIMEGKVREFNELPRFETCSGGMIPQVGAPNHWIFGITHIDMGLDPAGPMGEILMVLNQRTGQIYQGGPTEIFSLPTIEQRADAVIPCLLDVFTRPSTPMNAPWTWSTMDADLAQAMESRLKEHGVLPALCKVGVCTPDEREFMIESRERLHQQMMQFMAREILREPPALGDSTRCHGCRCKAECFFQPLKKCSGCGMTFYHSRECQKKHWKTHKARCGKPGANSSVPSSDTAIIDPYEYFKTEAPKDPAAKALLRSLRLEGDPSGHRVDVVIHRLVFTGQDTPENMLLLFGPHYTRDCEAQIKMHHERIRVELLVDPPRRSPWYAMNAQLGMFDPALVRAVRPANAAETRKVDEIRAIQAAVQRGIEAGKAPSLADLPASVQDFSRGLSESVRTVTLAEQMMEQDLDDWEERLKAKRSY